MFKTWAIFSIATHMKLFHLRRLTQASNLASIRKLKSVFGEMPIEAVKPKHGYQFKDIRCKQGKTAANRDIEVDSVVTLYN